MLKGSLHQQTEWIVPLASICCALPIATVMVCAIWAMQSDLTPVCFPLTNGCLSISAACREKPVLYLFRFIMLPMSIVLVVFWWFHHRLLEGLIPNRRFYIKVVLYQSTIGSAFLILYVLFLGTDGQVYEFLRRLGVYVFFAGVGVAQLMVTLALRATVLAMPNCQQARRARVAWFAQLAIVMGMLLSGLLNLVLKEVLIDARAVENIIEWNFGLIMFLWYGLQGIVVYDLLKSHGCKNA